MPNWSDWQAIPSDIMDASDNLQKASDWGDQQMQKVADMWAGKWNSFPLPASPAQAGGVTDPSSTGPLDSAPSPDLTAPDRADQTTSSWAGTLTAPRAGDMTAPDRQAPDTTAPQSSGVTPTPLATGTDPFQTKINNGPTLTRDETIKAGVSIGLTPDEAGYLWDKGVASNVDPGSALAIIKLEGNVHTSNNNMFDIQGGDGVTPTPQGDDPRWGAYQSHQAAIDAFYTLINGRYVPNGQDTIGTIMHGPGSTMDTTTTHAYAPIFENDKFYPQKVVDLVAGWHASGQEPISAESSGTADPSQTTAVPGRNPDGRAVATEDQRQFEREAGLSDADAYSACGPVAAAAFAKTYGRNPTPQEAIQLAQSVGWTGAQGMAGVHSEQDLLQKMGVNTKLEEGQQFNWGDVQRDAMNGNPVIIDTPGHYFYVSNYDPQTGKYYVGNSGLVFKGGTDWMTADQINARGGGARAALFADHPTAEGPSITEQNPDAPDQKSTDQNPLSQAVNGFHDLTSLAAQKVQDAVNAFGQNMQNPDQSLASNPTSAALGFVGGMANSANQAAQQVSQPVTNQQLTDVNAPGNQAARSLSVMLGAGDTDVSLDAMQSMMKDAQAAWDAATTDFRQSPVGQQMQMQMRTLQAKISSATAQSNTVQAAPGTPEIPASGTHSTTGFQGMRLNPTDTNTAGAPQPETPTAPVPADVTPAQTAPTAPAGAPPPPPPAPPSEAAQPVQQAAQRGLSDFYANNPPPVGGPPTAEATPPPEPQPSGSTLPAGARSTISQADYDAAVTRIENAVPDPDAAAAAHQQLDSMIQSGANPQQLGKFLQRDVEGNGPNASDILRTDRTGSMAGGLSTLGKVATDQGILAPLDTAARSIDLAITGRAGDIAPALKGAVSNFVSEGLPLAIQDILYGTNDKAALNGGAQGAFGYRAGLDVTGANPVTRGIGTVLGGVLRPHAAISDMSAALTRGFVQGAGGSADEAAQAGAQTALRNLNYGSTGKFVSGALDAAKTNMPIIGDVAGQYVLPFFGKAYNAGRSFIEYTPLGGIGTGVDVARGALPDMSGAIGNRASDALRGPYAPGADSSAVTPKSLRASRNLIGAGLGIWAISQAENGVATGANPKNGAPKWSVNIGGQWQPDRNLGPVGEAMAQAADVYEATRDGRGDATQVADRMISGYLDHVQNDSWLSSIGDAYQTISSAATALNPNAKPYDKKTAARNLDFQEKSAVNSVIPDYTTVKQAANSQGVTIPNQYIGKAQAGMTPLVGGSSNASSGPNWQTQLANLRNSPAYKSASPAQQQKMIAQAQADFSKETAASR